MSNKILVMLLVLIGFGFSAQSQTLSNINPSSSNAGSSLNVTITGAGINFGMGSSCSCPTCIDITQGSSTVTFYQGSSVLGPITLNSASGNTLGLSLAIPSTANLGLYNVLVDNGNCSAGCLNCFSVGPLGISPVNQTNEFTISPNPTKDVLHLKINTPKLQNARAELFDLEGKNMASFNVTSGQNQLNVSELKKGVYLLTIRSDKQVIGTQKIIIE